MGVLEDLTAKLDQATRPMEMEVKPARGIEEVGHGDNAEAKLDFT